MKVGIDIIENSRLHSMQLNKARLSKIFTETEINYFNKFSDPLTHISGNFCAKEAFVKALKTGFSKGLAPIDIEVLHTPDGAPYINTQTEKIKKFLQKTEKVDLSISHSDTVSTAVCIIYD